MKNALDDAAPQTPRPSAATPERGPGRFAAAPVEPERPSLAKAAGAAAVLLALLVGLPALLWILSGPPPYPHGLPSRDDLTQPLTTDALFVVLRAVVWLAWLQFAVCTVVEIVSLARGGRLPRPVPLSGRSQALARALVGTVLVGGSFLASTGAAGAVTGEFHGSAPANASTTVAGVAADDVTQALAGEGAAVELTMQPGQQAPDAAPQVRMQHVPGVPAEMTDVIGHKVAVVKAPDGHYHDNLWDIAERHLGDGRRWSEIFELNKGRQQPDGQQLVLGRLIQPGWVLKMPDDATGLQRVRAAQPTTQAGGGASGTLSAAETAGESAPQESGGIRAEHLLGGGMLGAVLLGALAAERRRRRGLTPTDEELDAEVALRVGADEARVAWLDRSLRGLSAACRTEQLALPQVYAASVSDEAIELRVAPAAPTAPAPWSVRDEGTRWRLDKDSEGPHELGHAPYPGLVCLGRDDAGADVLVDLESVGGILALDGDAKVAGEVVSALAVQLATAPWADSQRVRGYRLAPVLAQIGGSPVEEIDDLTAVVAELSAHPVRRDAGEVLTGRLGRHPGVAPQYLVLGARPDDAETTERLGDLAEAGSRGLAVLSASLLPGTRWHLVVDQAGRLSVPLLDLEVDAVRLDGSAAELLGGLFAKARTDEPESATERVSVPTAPRPGDDAAWSTAAVRVGVLGPLEVRTEGRMDPSRLELATELVTFVALQPAPVHPSVVAASVWPRGVTPEVRDATIARVRDWLGTGTDGSHLLRETEEGRLFLADEVAVDWHALCTLLRRARDSAPREERELLRRALQLVRGPVLSGRSGLRWAWLARTRLERQAGDVVVDAAQRLARLALDDDPSGAAAACRAGLRVAPTAQVLWRMLLLAESGNPDGPGTARVVDDMLLRLQGVGAPLEAETEALVAELLPGHEGASA